MLPERLALCLMPGHKRLIHQDRSSGMPLLGCRLSNAVFPEAAFTRHSPTCVEIARF